jgi:hypothetical protein
MAWPLLSLMPKEYRFADTFFDAKVEANTFFDAKEHRFAGTFFDAKESTQRKAPRIARKPAANSML